MNEGVRHPVPSINPYSLLNSFSGTGTSNKVAKEQEGGCQIEHSHVRGCVHMLACICVHACLCVLACLYVRACVLAPVELVTVVVR